MILKNGYLPVFFYFSRMKFPVNLLSKLEERSRTNSLRILPVRTDLVDFSSNDYLGFSRNKQLFDQVFLEMKRHKVNNGSSGSRLLSGNFPFHEELEIHLAKFFQAEAALLFNSGYDANIGLFSSVPQRGDRIFYDELSHASIRDGIRLSYAKAFSFRHNDLEDLQQKIIGTDTDGEIYVAVESVYSMDGDHAPLGRLANLSEKIGFKLIVDEAHSTGIFGSGGEGMIADQGLAPSVFARIHTFGKALGSHGATIAGSQLLKEYLINFARPFIYTTSLPMHAVLTIQTALKMLPEAKERKVLIDNISYFKQMVRQYNLKDIFKDSESPIQVALIHSTERVKQITNKLREHNYDAKPILSPTIPLGQERIRFCIHSYNTYAEIQEILFLLSTFV